MGTILIALSLRFVHSIPALPLLRLALYPMSGTLRFPEALNNTSDDSGVVVRNALRLEHLESQNEFSFCTYVNRYRAPLPMEWTASLFSGTGQRCWCSLATATI